MTIKEIKVGDWIGFPNPLTLQDEIGQITEIKGSEVMCGGFRIHLSDAFPIKLTEEILEKNNFEHYKDSKDNYWCTMRGEIIIEYDWYDKFIIGGDLIDTLSDNSLKYVHELQHLLWAYHMDDNLKL